MTGALNQQSEIGNRKSAMKVGLFVTCLVDQMWSSIGTSSVEVLRRAGCTVEFDERQTCCGQPAFNTGYRVEARRVAERFIELCEGSKAEAIVSPSGSCTVMVHHYEALFPEDEQCWSLNASAIVWFPSCRRCTSPSSTPPIFAGLSAKH